MARVQNFDKKEVSPTLVKTEVGLAFLSSMVVIVSNNFVVQ